MKKISALAILITLICSCKFNQPGSNDNVKVIPVNKDFFIKENIIGEITLETVDLRGITTMPEHQEIIKLLNVYMVYQVIHELKNKRTT